MVRKWNVKFGKGVGYRQVTRHKQDDFKKIWTSFQWEIKQYSQG